MRNLLMAIALLMVGGMAQAGEIFKDSDAQLDEGQQKQVDKIKNVPAVIKTQLFEFDEKAVEGNLTFTLPDGDKVEIKKFMIAVVSDNGKISKALHWSLDGCEGVINIQDGKAVGYILHNKKLYSVDTIGTGKKTLVLITKIDPTKIQKKKKVDTH